MAIGSGLLFAVGLLVAVFVGFNIGGSSTGVAFGPAVGSRRISKLSAAALMTGFALFGGATLGTNVIETMGGRIVPSGEFTLLASVGVLFFVGVALLISNLFGVPASTSMTAVGAIAGLGAATGSLRWDVLGEIVVWWLISPAIAFWVCVVVGRYLYPYIVAYLAIENQESDQRTTRELVGSALVVGIGCYMAFSAGASNVANAVAPLVGGGQLGLYQGVAIAGGAIGLGAFTIARRTLDTVGNDITDLPLTAALIVELISATIITLLSAAGIPASLAVSATMCIIGLGWGRATRPITVSEAAAKAVTGEDVEISSGGTALRTDAVNKDEGGRGPVAPIGEDPRAEVDGSDLFDPATTGRVVSMWILTPTIAAVASFVLFEGFVVA